MSQTPPPHTHTEGLQRPFGPITNTVYTYGKGHLGQIQYILHIWEVDWMSEMHHSFCSNAETRDTRMDFVPQLPQHYF